MLQTALFYESKSTNPYYNLAVETHLMENLAEHMGVFYLWQNAKTVVIGKNQNAYAECKVDELERSGGHLARRLSGGGAVFHDMGNLNFTFLTLKKEHAIEKQFEVVRQAAQLLGIDAQKTGRNDITVNGRKISGNSFFKKGERACHHGTVLVDINKEDMMRYLVVSKEKMRANGVRSVRARTANLKEFLPAVTVEMVKEALKKAYETVFRVKLTPVDLTEEDNRAIARLQESFAAKAYIFRPQMECSFETQKRFLWGSATVRLLIKGERIEGCQIFSDALDVSAIEETPSFLIGAAFSREGVAAAFSKARRHSVKDEIANDLEKMVLEWL